MNAQDICLKIGSNYFINCKNVISINGHPILQMTGDDATGRKVSFEIYSANGALDATLRDGKLSGQNANFYKISQEPNGFTLSDGRDKHIVLRVEGHYNEKEKRKEDFVWAQLYLPDGNIFQCTPETTNVEYLQYMSGSTFRNSDSAIELN